MKEERVWEIGEENNVLVYCGTCNTVLFRGNDKDARQNRLLNIQAFSHFEDSLFTHKVEIIHPRRTSNQSIQITDLLWAKLVAVSAGIEGLQSKSSRLLSTRDGNSE